MTILQRAKTAARDVALTPFAGAYALGGAINVATGGTTPTFSIWQAARGGGSTPEQTSTLIRAASLVRGDVDLEGHRRLQPQLPLLNPAGAELAGDLAADVTGFVGDVVEDGARGLGIGKILIGAGIAAGGLFLLSRRP